MDMTRLRAALAGWLCIVVGPLWCASAAADLVITPSKTSLDFAGFAGRSISAQNITFTVSNGSGTYYAQALTDRPGLVALSLNINGTNSAVAPITPLSSNAGRVSGNLTFRLCQDAQCASVAWSQSIPYTVTAFTISPSSLSFSGFEGAASAKQTVAISPADDKHQLSYTTAVSTPPNWLSVARDGDSALGVGASAAGLARGTYSGYLYITAANGGNGTTYTVQASYAVDYGIVATAPIVIDVTAEATAPSNGGHLGLAVHG